MDAKCVAATIKAALDVARVRPHSTGRERHDGFGVRDGGDLGADYFLDAREALRKRCPED